MPLKTSHKTLELQNLPQVDLEAAQRHLNQILSVKPMSWEALAQLIEVQWRRGKLTDAEQALDAAKLALGENEDPGRLLRS